MTTVTIRCRDRQPQRQSGVVLITGLIFLVVLTIIVVSIMRSGTLEERMAANAENRQLALQAAEAVLRDAEATVFAAAPFDPFTPSSFSATCTDGFCSKPDPAGTPRWKTIDWDSTAVTRTFAAAPSELGGISSQPRYIIEVISTPVINPAAGGGICPRILYRLTARGVGRDSAAVFVQTMYRHLPARC
jgi:type IV pilus assembly protein PilX